MKVYVAERKLNDFVLETLPLMDKEQLDPKILSSILGRMAAFIPSHGPMARICGRGGHVILEPYIRQKSATFVAGLPSPMDTLFKTPSLIFD